MTFVKGVSGNPNGRPVNDQSISKWLRRLAAEKRNGHTRAESIAATLLTLAEQGDINAIRTVIDRIDGKVPLPIEQSGTVTHEHVDRATLDRALDYAAERRRLRLLA